MVSPLRRSLSLSWYLGDFMSCLWLVKVARAHLIRWSTSTWAAFLKVVSWPRFLSESPCLIPRMGWMCLLCVHCCSLVVVKIRENLHVWLLNVLFTPGPACAAVLNCVECLLGVNGCGPKCPSNFILNNISNPLDMSHTVTIFVHIYIYIYIRITMSVALTSPIRFSDQEKLQTQRRKEICAVI